MLAIFVQYDQARGFKLSSFEKPSNYKSLADNLLYPGVYGPNLSVFLAPILLVLEERGSRLAH